MAILREESERAEEKEKAENAFHKIAGETDVIDKSDFPKLIESLGTVYCAEEHHRTLKKIVVDNKITRDVFLSWYIGWLFGEGDDDDESIDTESKDEDGKQSDDLTKSMKDWGLE